MTEEEKAAAKDTATASPAKPAAASKPKKPIGALIAIFALLFFISICIGVSIKLVFMYRNLRLSTLAGASQGQAVGAGQAQQPSDSQFNARVSQLADIISGEIPQEAVINNIDKVKEQNSAFYSNAQNGDILLIYKHRAVIYSPTRDRIAGMLWIP